MARDYRDAVIETLADDEAVLRDQAVHLAEQAAAYEQMTRVLINALHDKTVECDQWIEAYDRERDMNRAMRIRSLKADGG